jgi:ABC-type bacteriocin/lantibiotic exporter with double-glycine peptidase domain
MVRVRATAFWGLASVAGAALCVAVIGVVSQTHGTARSREPPRDPTVSARRPVATTEDAGDCGPACLYLVCRLAGRPSSLSAMRERMKTSPQGASMLDVKNAATSMGFHAEARSGSWGVLRGYLARTRSFAVLHVNRDHFVVATASPDTSLTRICDPARGVRDFDQEGFRDEFSWEGNMLVLTAPETREGKDR